MGAKKGTDSDPGYHHSRMPYWSCNTLAIELIYKSRNTVPSQQAGRIAVQPNGNIGQHVGVQGVDKALLEDSGKVGEGRG